MIDIEKLISSTQAIVEETDPFLIELYDSQQKHEKAINSSKSFRGTVSLYFERTENEAKAEKVLEFIKKLMANLTFALSETEKEIILLDQNKEKLSIKWTVYSALSSTLNTYPNPSMNRIRFELHDKNPDWENYLEDSTTQLLCSFENGISTASDLNKNIKSILSAILSKNGKFSASRITEIHNAKKECEESREILSKNLARLSERANVLSEILKNAFI